jgi:hypothetical protein
MIKVDLLFGEAGRSKPGLVTLYPSSHSCFVIDRRLIDVWYLSQTLTLVWAVIIYPSMSFIKLELAFWVP